MFLLHGFATIILHCLNLEDSVYCTVFVPSFKTFKVLMGEAVSFWQCLSMFFQERRKL